MAGIMNWPKAKIVTIRMMLWFYGKNGYPRATLYSVFRWGGYALLFCVMGAAIASADLQIARAAAIQSTGKHSPAAHNGRYIALAKPADKFPRPAQFHTCGALN